MRCQAAAAAAASVCAQGALLLRLPSVLAACLGGLGLAGGLGGALCWATARAAAAAAAAAASPGAAAAMAEPMQTGHTMVAAGVVASGGSQPARALGNLGRRSRSSRGRAGVSRLPARAACARRPKRFLPVARLALPLCIRALEQGISGSCDKPEAEAQDSKAAAAEPRAPAPGGAGCLSTSPVLPERHQVVHPAIQASKLGLAGPQQPSPTCSVQVPPQPRAATLAWYHRPDCVSSNDPELCSPPMLKRFFGGKPGGRAQEAPPSPAEAIAKLQEASRRR